MANPAKFAKAGNHRDHWQRLWVPDKLGKKLEGKLLSANVPVNSHP